MFFNFLVLVHLASTSGPFGFDWDFFSVGSLVVSSSLHPTSPGPRPLALQFFTASFVIVLHNHAHRHPHRTLSTRNLQSTFLSEFHAGSSYPRTELAECIQTHMMINMDFRRAESPGQLAARLTIRYPPAVAGYPSLRRFDHTPCSWHRGPCSNMWRQRRMRGRWRCGASSRPGK